MLRMTQRRRMPGMAQRPRTARDHHLHRVAIARRLEHPLVLRIAVRWATKRRPMRSRSLLRSRRWRTRGHGAANETGGVVDAADTVAPEAALMAATLAAIADFVNPAMAANTM